MTRVMATGVFDIIHPGHIHFLKESKKLGDELFVVVARDSTARKNGKEPIFDEGARLMIVSSIKYVDRAFLGHEGNIYETVRDLRPDIITLGFDQRFSEQSIVEGSKQVGVNVKVVRISRYNGEGIISSSQVRSKILAYIGDGT